MNEILKISFNYIYRKYQNDGSISSLLSTKYNNLSDLCNKMSEHSVCKRYQSIEEILNEKHLWLLSAQEFNPKNELERV